MLEPMLIGGMKVMATTVLQGSAIAGGIFGTGYVVHKVVHTSLIRKRFQSILSQTREDRYMHLQVIGKSGSGKTTLLKNLWKRDAEAGYNLVWIEVKEESECDTIMGLIPQERIHEVTYVSPYENDIGFNPLHLKDYDDEMEAFQIVDTVVNAFSEHYSDSWGAQTEMCLAMGTRAVLHLSRIQRKQHTLEDVYKILSDADYMNYTVCDELVLDKEVHFSVIDFCKEKGGYAKVPVTSKNSVQSKLRNFITHPLVRKTLCKIDNDLDFDSIVRDGILVCNLWKGGALGKMYSSMLASFIASNLQIATFRKKKKERKPTFFYYDEFQDYVNKSFEEALSQFRSYKTGVIVSHQYLTQLSKTVQQAIAGCVSSFIHFRAGEDDYLKVARRLQMDGDKRETEKYILEMPTLVCVTRLMKNKKLEKAKVISIPFVRGSNIKRAWEIRGNMKGVKQKLKVGVHDESTRLEHTGELAVPETTDDHTNRQVELSGIEVSGTDRQLQPAAAEGSGTGGLYLVFPEHDRQEVLPAYEKRV